MNEKEIKTLYREYENPSELSDSERSLIESAADAAGKAYAPYSDFRVGAAILLDDGTVIKGANVENAAFPSGSCAEKTVLSYSVSNFPDRHPVAIAITAISNGRITSEPVPPCGNCRQMLLEEELRTGKHFRVILAGKEKIFVLESCESLMPLHFNKANLKG
jgi:cytidine deaminase